MPTSRAPVALSWTEVRRQERLRRIEVALEATNAPTLLGSQTEPCAKCSLLSRGPEPRRCPVHDEDPELRRRAGTILRKRYRIESLLGSGGIGAVYRGWDLVRRCAVAIKLLRPEYAADPELLSRFSREAQTLKRLTHPHIVGVTDFDSEGPEPFIVMELLAGRSLEAELFASAVTTSWALSIIRQILSALAYSHQQGVVHRDLKPQNVMIGAPRRVECGTPGAEGHVKILDFGLVKLAPEARPLGDRTLTQGRRIFGTPAYMSPEQASGLPADPRSDLYSVGLILFELLTGRPPFTAKSPGELVWHHRMTPAPRMRALVPEAGVHPAIDHVVARALEKSPDRRFQTAAEFQEALDEAERASPSDTTGIRYRQDAPGTSQPAITAMAIPRPRALATEGGRWEGVLLALRQLAGRGFQRIRAWSVALFGRGTPP